MFYEEITEDYIKKNKWNLISKTNNTKSYEHKSDETLIFQVATDMEWLYFNLYEWYFNNGVSISKSWKIIIKLKQTTK